MYGHIIVIVTVFVNDVFIQYMIFHVHPKESGKQTDRFLWAQRNHLTVLILVTILSKRKSLSTHIVDKPTWTWLKIINEIQPILQTVSHNLIDKTLERIVHHNENIGTRKNQWHSKLIFLATKLPTMFIFGRTLGINTEPGLVRKVWKEFVLVVTCECNIIPWKILRFVSFEPVFL